MTRTGIRIGDKQHLTGITKSSIIFIYFDECVTEMYIDVWVIY